VPEDADRYPGYPYEECVVCGETGTVGSIDPFEGCEGERERKPVQKASEAD
jgi:hypothetical protein